MLDVSVLRERGAMLARCRAFFASRGVLEVDCCALNPRAAIDTNIDPIPAFPFPAVEGFLHTSPEYAMKRLLAAGSGDIYFLGHVFRQGEAGRLHSPEFCMAEWYRIGLQFEEMIAETADFLALFFGPLPLRTLSYDEAFQRYLSIDLDRASDAALAAAAETLQPGVAADSWSRTGLVQFLLSHGIEPKLGRSELTAIVHYPPGEAALARLIEKNGKQVAERFEIYCEGVELANGYRELPDSAELRRRFETENRQRTASGKRPFLLDEEFLAALSPSFPDCCGVSVGFDRALMLRTGKQRLADVLAGNFEYTDSKN